MRAGALALALILTLIVSAQADDPFRSAAPPKPAPAPRPSAEESTPNPAVRSSSELQAFDGTYKGGAPAVAICTATMVEVDVSKGKVSGIGYDAKINWSLKGSVSADGTFTGMNGGQVLTGRFQTGTFQGTYLSSTPQCGRRLITLQRTTAR